MTTTQPTLEQLLAPIRERVGHRPLYRDCDTLLAALDAVVDEANRMLEQHGQSWNAISARRIIQAAQSALAKGGE